MKDISDEDKAKLAKLSTYEKIHWVRAKLREHRETIHGLAKRVEKIEYEQTSMMFLFTLIQDGTLENKGSGN